MKVKIQKRKNEISQKNYNHLIRFKKYNQKFLTFPSFQFGFITKIENSKILEMFPLLQFLRVYETQDPKIKENVLRQKKYNFMK